MFSSVNILTAEGLFRDHSKYIDVLAVELWGFKKEYSEHYNFISPEEFILELKKYRLHKDEYLDIRKDGDLSKFDYYLRELEIQAELGKLSQMYAAQPASEGSDEENPKQAAQDSGEARQIRYDTLKVKRQMNKSESRKAAFLKAINKMEVGAATGLSKKFTQLIHSQTEAIRRNEEYVLLYTGYYISKGLDLADFDNCIADYQSFKEQELQAQTALREEHARKLNELQRHYEEELDLSQDKYAHHDAVEILLHHLKDSTLQSQENVKLYEKERQKANETAEDAKTLLLLSKKYNLPSLETLKRI
ncbi:MAG: hypothetical protein Q9220_002434 [cf. Caloplaca sp. 1 TL-2023]